MSAPVPARTPIRTLLVANRGEIACRVLRTARAMGLRTVAVFSDADADAPHVAGADLAVRLPGVSPRDTYLRADLLVEAALRTGADAVHPGYGFLSENADFVRRADAAGLVFVGPSAGGGRRDGLQGRGQGPDGGGRRAVLPGATVTDDADLAALGHEIGYPLLVKASVGGGGRGMRVVDDPDAAGRRRGRCPTGGGVRLRRRHRLPGALRAATRGTSRCRSSATPPARSSTSSSASARCSAATRRSSRSAPSPAVTPALRERLGAAAVTAGRALGYVGAGTVEFVLDRCGAFHFLEVNTRLQVEHPVTELVTGLDLVRLQLLVAQGEPLPAEVRTARMTGHAIEVRLYAEDPAAGFRPSAGRLRAFAVPGPVRVDAGVVAG